MKTQSRWQWRGSIALAGVALGFVIYPLIEGKNDAFDQEGTPVYSFINRVLIARRPIA